MKSPVVKRSIVVAGHKTSVSLEEAFWNGMKEISGLRDMTLSELVGEIDGNRQQGKKQARESHGQLPGGGFVTQEETTLAWLYGHADEAWR